MFKVLVSFLLLTCFSLVFSQPIPFEPDANTVGLWHFNEGAGGIAYDTSGNSLDGTLENGVTWDPDGMFGNCILFNADYERVKVEDTSILDIPTDLTIEAWINLDSTNNLSTIISKWNTVGATPSGQYFFAISSTNKLFCYLGDDISHFAINSDSTLVEFNEWMLVSAVFTNGNAGLFINNEQVAASEVLFDSLTTLDYTNDDLYIGDLWTDQISPYSFDGKIDEVRISNIARYQINLVGVEADDKYIVPLIPFLEQNYPNPFNPSTKIKYQLIETGFTTLKVFDVLGNTVATLVNGEKPIGKYEVEFNSKGLTSGIYFYQLKAEDFIQTKKMILVK